MALHHFKCKLDLWCFCVEKKDDKWVLNRKVTYIDVVDFFGCYSLFTFFFRAPLLFILLILPVCFIFLSLLSLSCDFEESLLKSHSLLFPLES